MANPLLPDLLIEGYRGLRRLELKKLGNVNLFIGENGVGKTSVLEAVRLYSSQASISDLAHLLHSREEAFDASNWQNFLALFLNRSSLPNNAHIRIGPQDSLLTFSIKSTVHLMKEGTISYKFVDEESDELAEHFPTLTVEQAGKRIRFAPQDPGRPNGLQSQYIDLPSRKPNPTNTFVDAKGLDYAQFATLWDRIVLTDFEEQLNIAVAAIIPNLQRVSLVQKDGGSRRAMAKLSGAESPVPLRTLGDGIHRYIGIALALANARNGFLLIDEFENGLHYKTQQALWNFVIRLARELNVQVFATTHSRDCIGAFGRAAEADKESTGMLFRIEEFRGEIVETHFEEESIRTITRNLVEVR